MTATKTADQTIPAEVLNLLRAAYTDDGCLVWWSTRNRNLDGWTPQLRWMRGGRHSQAVLDEASRLSEGNG